MATFYAKYPAQNPSSTSVSTVQGEGTAGTPTGGLLTIQGDPSGTPIPISGSITATNPSVSATGSAVPASGTYIAASVGGTLTGLVATANGLKVDGSAATQPVSGTVTANQGGAPWTVTGTVTANQGGAPWTVTGTGTAGTAASGVVTVQGIASMTALKVDGTGGTFPVSGTVAVTQSTSPWVCSATQSGTWNIGTVTTLTGITNTVTTDQVASTAATFQDGAIAFGSLTGSYATVITAGGDLRNVSMRNNTNGVVLVSLNSGSSASYTLDSGDAISLDLKTLGVKIASGATLQAKHNGVAPTSGSIRINAVY